MQGERDAKQKQDELTQKHRCDGELNTQTARGIGRKPGRFPGEWGQAALAHPPDLDAFDQRIGQVAAERFPP